MSVTSVPSGRSTPYSPVSGNNSQSAKFAAPAKQSQQNPAIQEDGSQVTSTRVNGATPDSAVPTNRQGAVGAGHSDPTDIGQFQSTFAQARRTDGATAAGATSGTSESDGSQSSAGIALYKRISQLGNNEPSTSELLRSWNSVMQSGQDPGDTGTATLQALLQNGTPAFGSSILDVTA